MRLLILGGSFNPLHIGHLQVAEDVAFDFSYDRILLVPAFSPPHKELDDDPGPGERLAMLRDAVEGDERYVVEPCELERGGRSYTIDTVKSISDRYDIEGRPGLLLGDDLASGFRSWRDPDGIAGLCDLVVARREGLAFELGYPHRLARNAVLPISSSDIRSRIRSGRPWIRLVPAAVALRIRERGLYGIASARV